MKCGVRMKCEYCNSPMKENDVFCKSCWKITPKVREMINAHPNRHPNDYQIYSTGYSYRCPHCGGIIKSTLFERIPGLKIDSPIKRCKKCQKYFLDTYNIEWSVSSTSYVSNHYFAPWLFFLIEIYLFDFISDLFSVQWAFICCFIYLLLHFPIRILLSEFAQKRAKERSQKRLEQNPEYPQLLADMGYGEKMAAKYHTMMKQPPRKTTLKEILKDAITFD